MNGKLFILFGIIVVALLLASFLGGSVIENMENPTDNSADMVVDVSQNVVETNMPVTVQPPVADAPTMYPVISVPDESASASMPVSVENIPVQNMPAQNMPAQNISQQIMTQTDFLKAVTPAPIGPSLVRQNQSFPFPISFPIITPPITIPSMSITPLNPLTQQSVQQSVTSQEFIQPSPMQPVGTTVSQVPMKTTSDFDNYNHYNKTSYPDMFYSSNGGTARIIDTGSNNMLVITSQNGKTDIYYLTGEKQLSNAYYGPNGSTAKVETADGVVSGLKVLKPDGSTVYYYKDQGKVTKSVDQSLTQKCDNTEETVSGSSKGSGLQEAFTLPLKDEKSKWMAVLPKGIPKSQIAPGEENLYILKSEVIPPVCPKCPEPIVNCPGDRKFDAMKCPPCPPCARCPQADFECKKVPSYNAVGSRQSYMPVPVVADFSAFGM